MFYNSSKYDSIFDWLFSISGIIFILVLILVIWLLMRFFGNKDKKNNEDVYASPRTNYVEEFGSDNSFWDDLKEGKEENPQREEEPIPPNAIQPNMAVVNTECDYNVNQNGELEKDCTKQIIARDMYVDESAVNIVESQSNENKGE